MYVYTNDEYVYTNDVHEYTNDGYVDTNDGWQRAIESGIMEFGNCNC